MWQTCSIKGYKLATGISIWYLFVFVFLERVQWKWLVPIYIHCNRMGPVTQAPTPLLWLFETKADLCDKKEKNLWPETLCHAKTNITSHAWNNNHEKRERRDLMKGKNILAALNTLHELTYQILLLFFSLTIVQKKAKHDEHVCFNNHRLQLNVQF